MPEVMATRSQYEKEVNVFKSYNKKLHFSEFFNSIIQPRFVKISADFSVVNL